MGSDKPAVLCLGDSHTLGMLGGSWVRSLAATLPELHFVNTGVNGTQTKNVHSQLEKLITGCKGRLASVTLLIGTNDCLLSIWQDKNDFWGQQQYRIINGDTGPVSIETFGEQYWDLLAELSKRLRQIPAAPESEPVKLLIINLPPIGEDLDSEDNKRVDKYNAVIRAAASELQKELQPLDAAKVPSGAASVSLRVALLDLNAACKAAITRALGGAACTDGSCAAAALTPCKLPKPFWRCALSLSTCLLRRFAFGIGYNRQSALSGTVVLTPDGIHLNDTGAGLLANMVEQALRPQVLTATTIAADTATTTAVKI